MKNQYVQGTTAQAERGPQEAGPVSKPIFGTPQNTAQDAASVGGGSEHAAGLCTDKHNGAFGSNPIQKINALPLPGLKSVWEALPEAAWFDGFFESGLVDMESARRRIDEHRKRMQDAEDDLARAEGELCGRIRRRMETEWTGEQISVAMAAAFDRKEETAA